MHCLYFICERKFYASTYVKIKINMRGRGNQPINPDLSYPRDLEDQFNLFFCIPVMLGFSFNRYLKVQTRQWNCGANGGWVATCNCGVVVRDHNDVIEFTVCSDSLRYNEITPIRYSVRSKKCLSPGVSIKRKTGARSVDYEVSLFMYLVKV